MNKLELTLAADMLKVASEECCNNGCNDYCLDNTYENRQLVLDIALWNVNGDKAADEYTNALIEVDTNDKHIYVDDYSLMSYLSYKFKLESNKNSI